MEKLLWKTIVPGGEAFHLVRATWGRNILPFHHSHDFAEIFWIEEGRCCHHINGARDELRKGDIVFMRPSDAHHFTPLRGGFTFTNLAFPLAHLEALTRRFPAEMDALFPANQMHPVRKPLGNLLGEVSEGVIRLSEAGTTAFWFERFFLNLAGLMQPARFHPERSDAPDWLAAALWGLRDPGVFTAGVAGFIKVAGRSHAHVTRAARKHYGKTPARLVTEARMAHAGRSLRLTSKSVLEIGMECGYSKPSRFFKVFKDHFGMSPLQYRKAQNAVFTAGGHR